MCLLLVHINVDRRFLTCHHYSWEWWECGLFHVFVVTGSDPCNIRNVYKPSTYVIQDMQLQIPSLQSTPCVWTKTTEWTKSKWHVIWAVQKRLIIRVSTWYTTLLGPLRSFYITFHVWINQDFMAPRDELAQTISTSQRSSDFAKLFKVGRVTFTSPPPKITTKNHPTFFPIDKNIQY